MADTGTATTATTTTPARTDGAVLHFLKELPGWVVVSAALVFFTIIYLRSRDDFIPRILDALIGAFLGLVVAQRPRPSTGSTITADTVQTDMVNTESMPDAVVNAAAININKEPKGE